MPPAARSDLVDLDREKATAHLPRKWSLAESLEASPGRWIVIFTAVYLIAEICAANKRPFWFDELINYYLSDLPSIRQIWPLIGQGIELSPPLPFWITWAVHHTVGGGEVLSRLPAVAGFWLMCLCLYWFVRRRSDTLHGFIALLLPLFTYTAWDATVKGYGLMLGALAASLLCWQFAVDGSHRRFALAGLAPSIAIAVSSHYYALYAVGALGLGEIARTIGRRRIDVALWIALGAGVSPMAAYASLLRTAASGALSHFWTTPAVEFLYKSYADLLGPGAIAFLLLLILALWSRPGDPQTAQWSPAPMPRHEMIACAALVAMPAVVFAAAMFRPVPFFPRYVMPVVIGFTILVALFTYRVGGTSRRFQKWTISLLVWICLLPWAFWHVWQGVFVQPPAQAILKRAALPLHSTLAIVFDSNDHDFMETYYYSPPDLRARLFNLIDTDASIRFRGSDTALRSIRIAQTFRDLHTVEYRDFVRSHGEFLVVRKAPEGWVIQKLLADGAKVELVSLKKEPGFDVSATLVFHVSFPEPASRTTS